MNLDKDDIMRILLPGLTFWLVLVSFQLTGSKLNFLNDLLCVKGLKDGLFVILIAYPIGFLVHIIYRTVGHAGMIWFNQCSETEQLFMERQDWHLVPNRLRRILRNKLNLSNCETVQARVISQFLDIALNDKQHKRFKQRLSFLMSYIHSLGACSTSIFVAIGLIMIPKFLFLLQTPREIPIDLSKFIWLFVWISIFMIIREGRRRTKESQERAMRVFMNSSAFAQYVNAF
ncbi:MAG: hypothetical protein H6757_07230 [Candidatus Omnitrophica bacterium]|nr:hypothetical protein [Candidatus Omnitrophota bacterium]